MGDLFLAMAHHVLVFTLAMILAAEAALLRPGMAAAEVRRLGLIDAAYGASAVAILAVGAARVLWGAKPAAFYLENPMFWTKIGLFAVVGLLSIRPTMRLLVWGRRARGDARFAPPAGEIAGLRRLIFLEAAVFAAIQLAAAAMARGYGL